MLPHRLHQSPRPVQFHQQKGPSIVCVGRSLDGPRTISYVLFLFLFFSWKKIRLIFGTLLAFDFILLRLLKRPPLMRWRHWSYKYLMCWMPWHLRVPRILDPGVKPQRTRSVILFQYFLVVFSICISTSSYSS